MTDFICGPKIYGYEGWTFELHAWCGPWPIRKDGELFNRAGRVFYAMYTRFQAEPDREKFRVGGGCVALPSLTNNEERATSGMKTYIAGPMSDRPALNFKEFFRAQLDLEALGFEVVNPAELDVIETLVHHRRRTWEECLEEDLYHLGTCVAIYLLAGWQDSEGACIEYQEAERLGLVILEQEPEGDESC